MNAKKVKGIKCPSCDDFIAQTEFPTDLTLYQCSECAEVYTLKSDAEECCKE